MVSLATADWLWLSEGYNKEGETEAEIEVIPPEITEEIATSEVRAEIREDIAKVLTSPEQAAGAYRKWKGYNDLSSCMPHIARDWYGTKNRRLRPDEVYKESTKKVWWKCSQCGYEWFGSNRGRTVNGIGCKKCHRNNSFIV